MARSTACCLIRDWWVMTPRSNFLSRTAAILLLAASLPVAAADTARDWLQQMSHAMQSLNYEGTFVYIHGSDIESMRIIHGRDANGERERLVSLNGEAREIIRDDSNVTCIWPGSKSVIVSKSRPRTPFPALVDANLGDLNQHYDFSLAGDDRVAGMRAQVVEIMPRDKLRYGYRIWIDRDSHLLLRSELLDGMDEAIEQVMFTRLAVHDAIPSERFRPVLQGAGYTWHRDGELVPVSRQSGPKWHFAELPPGFERLSSTLRPLRENGSPVHHVILSDGLASVSVYIEQGSAASAKQLEGGSSMGGVSAFGQAVGDLHVTAVGEVPLATVRAVSAAVRAGTAN